METAVSSGNKTTTYNNELIYGASIGASGALTKGAQLLRFDQVPTVILSKIKTQLPSATYDANFTSASGDWIAQMATFISTSSSIHPAG